MKIKEFAKKWLPKNEGHSEDMEFLNDIDNTFESLIISEDWEEFTKYKLHINNNPNL